MQASGFVFKHITRIRPGRSFALSDCFYSTCCCYYVSACNAVSTNSDGSATLSNYGLRSNCSLLFVYPELINVVRLDVGQIILPRTRVSTAHLPTTVVRATQHHTHFHAVTRDRVVTESTKGSFRYFHPHDALHRAVFAVVRCLSVCPSVCPSIRLSHAGIVSKQLNLS